MRPGPGDRQRHRPAVHRLELLRDRPQPAERAVHDADPRHRDLDPGDHLGLPPAASSRG